MVTRDRKFSTPPGYSRQSRRREAERIVAEEFEVEEVADRATWVGNEGRHRTSRVALDLEPEHMPRGGIDLSAVTRGAAQSRARRPLPPAVQWLVQAVRRLGQRLFHWISWK